ncbi:hypothetical protein DUNSADRAFT_15040 [Dunaliella salina]|uniref:CMP/dCMP-type deaminase domain-containing protein n=1 Tax=Dunaliella salina TaxID=3046 RepID=A0ABQ7G668_DUNSA|nr:hypothetical protein DUNSADRAFT_15040 [Dunaliella salina]|eukprot:KAF5830102.1 hypothetical protein DUNSADRAFT_15040 [Dunaliella salina]
MHIVHPQHVWSHSTVCRGRCATRRLQAASGRVTRAAGRESSVPSITEHDLSILRETASLSTSSAGLTQPHPNSACILVGPDGRRLASTYQRAAGAVSSEVQALRAVREGARGGVAYLNLESGDCHGDGAAVRALVDLGVSRVVVGLEHPLPHARGVAVRALRSAGIDVDVLSSSTPCAAEPTDVDDTIMQMLEANEALLHRAVLRRPLSILK